eukprot:6367421-Prymnesium_polylepis.1
MCARCDVRVIAIDRMCVLLALVHLQEPRGHNRATVAARVGFYQWVSRLAGVAPTAAHRSARPGCGRMAAPRVRMYGHAWAARACAGAAAQCRERAAAGHRRRRPPLNAQPKLHHQQHDRDQAPPPAAGSLRERLV